MSVTPGETISTWKRSCDFIRTGNFTGKYPRIVPKEVYYDRISMKNADGSGDTGENRKGKI